MHPSVILGAVVVGQLAFAAYSNPPWPYSHQLYEAEYLLYEGDNLGTFSVKCATRDSTSVAAQWLRIAYHDMSTHDVNTGTGGLDGSIRFELDRPENVGIGMNRSLGDFSTFQSPHVSMADLIAMGAVFALPSCGGPFIPYRVGRVDAVAAGVPGVPEPQQSLQNHIDSFERQGFTKEEMIALVACGHTIGGVRSVDFPDITSQGLALFHGEQQYDITVVTDYLKGTTPNPLVTSINETMRSDFRIFSSDGNTTMQRLADRDTFNKECSSLIERMINTVPKGVTLSDVIEPIEYKVGKARLFPSNETDNLVLTTTLRTLDLTDNPQRTFTLFWADRQGNSCPSTGCSVTSYSTQPVRNLGLTGFGLHGIVAQNHFFRANVNQTTSISKFWFEIDENDGLNKLILDNDGKGYEIDQDIVLFDPSRSRHFIDTHRSPGSFDMLTVAVKSEKAASVSLTTFDPDSEGSIPFIPKIEVLELPLDTSNRPMAGYMFFTANTSMLSHVTSFDVHASVDGGTVTQEFIQNSEIEIQSPILIF
ncbi:heme peroxidase [Marasmius fiardii PR-910]|nr:heme peroxidase [Marasmius fiardii PR-910]